MNARARAIARLKLRVRHLAHALSAVEELADRVNSDLSLLTDGDFVPKQHQAASPVAVALKASPLPDGSCLVSIDDSAPVRMARRLWSFLAILADEATGESADACVGWKSEADVRVLLGKATGQPVSAHNLATLTWRLREALGAERRGLVQTRKAEGLIRFALRRSAPTQVVITV